MGKLRILAGTIAAVTAAAVTGGPATDPNSGYYRSLSKPPWQPAPPVFGLVWTPLYADIALTTGHAIARLSEDPEGGQGPAGERRRLITALGVNLAMNAGWTWLFFRARRPRLAAAECAALTASSVDLARRVGAVDRRAGVALVPYPLWCAFATALSTAIAHRNPLR